MRGDWCIVVALGVLSLVSFVLFGHTGYGGPGDADFLSAGPGFHYEESSWIIAPARVNVQPSQEVAASTPAIATAASTTPASKLDSSASPGVDQIGAVRWSAWIYLGRSRALYEPAILTMQEALSEFGVTAKEANGLQSCEVQSDVGDVMRQPGAMALIIAIGWYVIEKKGQHRLEDACGYRKTLQALGDLGAYLVLYNTEPTHHAFMMAPGDAEQWKAKEIWSYSRAEMPFYKKYRGQFQIRYFPPGCARAMDAGVQTNATARNINKIGFVGNWVGRSPGERQSLGRAFSGSVHPVHGISTLSQWREYLEEFPLQLNVHASWNQNFGGFEALRVAMLATNGACVLSSKSHSWDQVRWESVVQFLDLSGMHQAFQRLRNNNTAILECQLRSRAEMCSKFNPRSLLEESGFVSVLRNGSEVS